MIEQHVDAFVLSKPRELIFILKPYAKVSAAPGRLLLARLFFFYNKKYFFKILSIQEKLC